MSDLRSLSLSSGDEGRFGPFRGEEDMDHFEQPPRRVVAEGWSRPNESALDRATRIVRQDAFVGRSPRTGGRRIGAGPAYYRGLDDARLVSEMRWIETELTRRYGEPSDSEYEEEETGTDDETGETESFCY